MVHVTYGDEVHRATSHLVGEEGHTHVCHQGERLHASIDAKLGARVGDTNLLHDLEGVGEIRGVLAKGTLTVVK